MTTLTKRPGMRYRPRPLRYRGSMFFVSGHMESHRASLLDASQPGVNQPDAITPGQVPDPVQVPDSVSTGVQR
jgi:hypothetical protein